jgi:hypothetical protein
MQRINMIFVTSYRRLQRAEERATGHVARYQQEVAAQIGKLVGFMS